MGVLQVVLFAVLWSKWSVKNNCEAKVFLAIAITIIPNFTNQKQELGFQQVDGLETRSISVSYKERFALCFKPLPNLIDFYKEIFSNVIQFHGCSKQSSFDCNMKVHAYGFLHDFRKNVFLELFLCLTIF